jgi:hypothetical protein
MTRRPSSLPDLSDDELARRLNPLAVAILPSQSLIEAPSSPPREENLVLNKMQPAADAQDSQVSGVPEHWSSGGRASELNRYAAQSGTGQGPPLRRSPSLVSSSDRVAAAAHLEKTAAARGERRGIEFLLPERVIAHLRQEAAAAGISMSLRLLQILREASYPVISEDFVDLRKLPKR